MVTPMKRGLASAPTERSPNSDLAHNTLVTGNLGVKGEAGPILYDRKLAARALSVCPRTIDSLVKDGDLRPVRIGQRVLFPFAELERFAASLAGGGL